MARQRRIELARLKEEEEARKRLAELNRQRELEIMRQREYELELQRQRRAEELEKQRLEAQRRHQKWLQLRGWQNPRSFAFNVLQHTILAIPKLPELGYTKGNPVAHSTLDRLMNKPMLEVQPYRLDKKKALKHRRFAESDIENS